MEKQIKVIICADDGEWSRENTDALASRGAQVLTVNRNGTALLTKIRDEKPDVVVMDLFMAGVDALGCNCGVGPEQLVSLLPRFIACVTKPLMMQPNAGLPVYEDGETRYLVGPEAFVAQMRLLANGGVWGLGGCCGTTPAHIALLSALAH